MNRKSELPRNADGDKLYPICNFERNKHKIIDVLEYAEEYIKGEHTDEDMETYEMIKHVSEIFGSCVIDGTAYATWEDSRGIRELIYAYNTREDNRRNEALERCNVPYEYGWEEYEEWLSWKN